MSCDWSPARSRDLTRASHWSARELRPLLVFIWAKILAVDPSCQHDLVRDQSHKYFLTVLQDPAMLVQHKTWAVFVLTSVVRGYKQVLYCNCTVMYCTVLYCTVLYCTVLYCTVLYCTVL